eukprot:3285923-Prymnesium_polylepis.1
MAHHGSAARTGPPRAPPRERHRRRAPAGSMCARGRSPRLPLPAVDVDGSGCKLGCGPGRGLGREMGCSLGRTLVRGLDVGWKFGLGELGWGLGLGDTCRARRHAKRSRRAPWPAAHAQNAGPPGRAEAALALRVGARRTQRARRASTRLSGDAVRRALPGHSARAR